jgi:flagellar hook-associated protein 1 FlgK
MQAQPALDDPERTIVVLRSPTGSTVNIPESMLSGGTLGGLIAFRSEALDPVQNGLGRIALNLAQNFNDQHQLGQDLLGSIGGDYFDMGLMGPSVRANSNNTGSGAPVVTIADVAALTTSDYRLRYDGVNFTLLRLSDNVATTITAVPQIVDGMSIDVSAPAWSPNPNDSMLIQPTRNGGGNIAMAVVDPRNIAAATPIRTATPLANAGTASIDGGVVTATTNLPLAGTVTLTYNALTTAFDITGPTPSLPFSVPYVSGQPISFDGMTVTVNGAPADGDAFTISNNANGVADNRNAQLLGALQTATPMVNGTASYQSAYSQIVSQVGNRTRQVEVTGKAQQNLADQAKQTLDQVSGVNLDEEAANLLRYQQAYQASAKMIDIAGRLFDEILALGR